MTLHAQIDEFLDEGPFAVVGASKHRHKYGNMVLRAYLQNGLAVWPINPNAESVEGIPCVARLSELKGEVRAVSVITPPEITRTVLDEAMGLGIRQFWLQPGAEHLGAIDDARRQGANVIAGGPCLLVVLGFREGS